MAWKHHIDVGGLSSVFPLVGLATSIFIHIAGVIDADYRGNVGVVLFNLSQKPYEGNWNGNQSRPTLVTALTFLSMATVKRHDRIAQLVLEKISTPLVMEAEVTATKYSVSYDMDHAHCAGTA